MQPKPDLVAQVQRHVNPVQERMESDRRRSMLQLLFIAYEETSDRDERVGGVPEWHLRCYQCGQSVLRLMSGGTSYHWSPVQLVDRFTAHYRLCHPEALGG